MEPTRKLHSRRADLEELRHAAATCRHLDLGQCPDPDAPGDRDPWCPVCLALGPADHEETP